MNGLWADCGIVMAVLFSSDSSRQNFFLRFTSFTGDLRTDEGEWVPAGSGWQTKVDFL